MNPAENLSLTVEEATDFVRYRSMLAAMAGLKTNSEAGDSLRLAPDFSAAQVREHLKEFDLIYKETGAASVSLTLKKEGVLVHAYFRTASLRLDVMAEDDTAPDVLASLLNRFKPYIFVNKEPDGIWVEFAYLNGDSVARQTQFLRCPTWKDIHQNYPHLTQSSMERLLKLKAPWNIGRLIIWHGVPGTGKTYAIRALMKAWMDRFDFIIINDPENFAASPGYYYKVSSRGYQVPNRFKGLVAKFGVEDYDDDDEDDTEPKKKRHLFILEDSADLVLQESRTSHYDKLGKLLNMTDGLFGQGREDLFLITFNEELTRIDPAFLRPGRCITKIEFPKFTGADGTAWLKAKGVADGDFTQEITIAELYAKLNSPKDASIPVAPPRKQIGFGKA